MFWFRLHRFGVTILPTWALSVVLDLFTAFFWVALRKIRAAIASNLEAVLGPCGWWERQRRIHRTFRTFAWCLSERYERLSTDRVFAVEAEGLEAWRELRPTAGGLHPGHRPPRRLGGGLDAPRLAGRAAHPRGARARRPIRGRSGSSRG